MGAGGGGGSFGKTKGGRQNSSTRNRLYGRPGNSKKSGTNETFYGPDGRAELERHYTDHGTPNIHTNPHDHIITWDDKGNPDFGEHINIGK